jgi:hypothetical protein
MTLAKLKQEANVISSMVIGNSRKRIFKLDGNKYLVEEDLSSLEFKITNI